MINQTQFNLEQKHQNSDSNTYFPLTILTVSRNEYYGQDAEHQPLKLTIKDGLTNQETELPEDLQGHVFILSPVGSIASQQVSSNNPNHQPIVWSSKDGWTPLYNGDGMVYRLSFQDQGATLKTRLMKPACYYADRATLNPNKDYQELGFYDLGISRNSSEFLGARNQVNTAFLRFKTPKDEHERLLVTWDVGRPHELDPETLETLGPVGNSGDWASMLPTPEQPFKQLMTSAHPCFAPDENKVYTINVGKSFWTMFGLLRSIRARLRENSQSIKNLEQNPKASKLVIKVLKLYRRLLNLAKFSVKLLGFFSSIFQKFAKHNFVHLLRWDGKQVGIEQQWNILLPGNKPLVIDQTVHQMGLTEKYLIIAESSFKFSLENTLPYQRATKFNSFKIFLADLFDYPQFPSTKLYIVKREDLEKAAKQPKPWWSFLSFKKEPPLPVATAKEVNIKPEFSHYLLDYKNPHDRIILHASHLAASDIAECIRSFNTSYYDNRDDDSEEDLYD
ncbi:MAG: carotenoid oxygenase family protein, partial [Xenococcus sp. (in: cyanobacteria)]